MLVQKLIVPVVPYRTLKACFALRSPVCEGAPACASGLVLRIERIHCPRPPLPIRQVWNGCCHVPCDGAVDAGPPPCASPVIEYPVFDTDSQGRVCFYFDRLLYTQPEGRYKAVILHGERELLAFGLALEAPPPLVEQVAMVEAQECCTECPSCRFQ
ncbi:hypothetical protein [Paraburkholderia dinghuensis]|uniref:Uncharacterized protein n=1 Tax=Paraburkholderia dinghuensis TaxID=2305225 RepID=A0A3N6NDM4_9BURK|nr:hypothetical protein [Paraburkholderia dinghuensis]RQH06617.1 hypothetical protein D1Y85_12150 [Paraburkholderia dinghuensis]